MAMRGCWSRYPCSDVVPHFGAPMTKRLGRATVRVSLRPVPTRLRRRPGWRRHTLEARRHLDPMPPGVRSTRAGADDGTGGVWAVGMVRDEADVIETVIGNLLAQGVERVVIADNLSTDDTPAVLERLARSHPVTVLVDRLPAYYQAEKTTLLARAAVRAGARWVLPFDADEVWTAPDTTVAQWLAT